MVRTLMSTLLMSAALALPAFHAESAAKKEDPKKAKAKDIPGQVVEGIVDLYKQTFEGELDLKIRSWSIVDTAPGASGTGKHIKLLVEFTKDADEKKWYERIDALGKDGPYVEFFFFDEDNVRLGTRRVDFSFLGKSANPIEGQVTLKKGEAVRLFVPTWSAMPDAAGLQKTKRVEVHVRMPKKKS
jgi:hypothetical protein